MLCTGAQRNSVKWLYSVVGRNTYGADGAENIRTAAGVFLSFVLSFVFPFFLSFFHSLPMYAGVGVEEQMSFVQHCPEVRATP